MRRLGPLLALLAVPATAHAAPLAETTVNGAVYRLDVADAPESGSLAFTATRQGEPRRLRVPLATAPRAITAYSEVDCDHGGVVVVAGTVGRDMGRVQAKLDDGQRLEVTRVVKPFGTVIALIAPSRVGVLYIVAYDDDGNRLGVLRPKAVRPCGDSRPIEPRLLDGSFQRDLDAAMARWRRAKLAGYRLKATCTGCGRRITRVERLFHEIQLEADRRPGRLVVEYGAHGVPRRFIGDTVSFTARLRAR